jgi:hypothetical protein
LFYLRTKKGKMTRVAEREYQAEAKPKPGVSAAAAGSEAKAGV